MRRVHNLVETDWLNPELGIPGTEAEQARSATIQSTAPEIDTEEERPGTVVVQLGPDLVDALEFAASRLGLPTARLVRDALTQHLQALDLPVGSEEGERVAAVLKLRRREPATSTKKKRPSTRRKGQKRTRASKGKRVR